MATIAERKDLPERSLERIVAVLVKEYGPEKIILFGSLASGYVHEGSDLDLVITCLDKSKICCFYHDIFGTCQYVF